jgi:saccharopine dehydrogenase (NAD+, L-lysine-forming)
VVDVRDPASLDAFLHGADVVVNATQYEVNLEVMEGALRAGAHYTDLGGLFYTTRKQLLLDERFRDAGLTAVLGIGSCPGIANVHAGDIGRRLDTVKSIKIYNGATVDESDSLKWPYSLWTIFEEIVERPMVFRGVSSSISTLSRRSRCSPSRSRSARPRHTRPSTRSRRRSLAEKEIEDCEFKIRFWGFSEGALRKLEFLASLGPASTEPRRVGDVDGVVPRRLLVDLLEELQPDPPEHAGFKDIATVGVGTRDGVPVEFRFDTTAWPSRELKVAGGTVVVGTLAAIVARWLAGGRIPATGVLPPETAIDPQPFYDDMAVRGIRTTFSEERVLAG